MSWPRFASILVTIAIGCSSSEPPPSSTGAPDAPAAPPASVTAAPPAPTPPAGTRSLQSLVVSSGDLEPVFDPAITEYTITALGSMFPIDVTAKADPTFSLTLNGQTFAAGVATPLHLAPREDIVVTVGGGGAAGARSYTIRYLPPTFPDYAVTKTDPAESGSEPIFLTADNKWLFVVNRDGDPLYYRKMAPLGVTDFKEHPLAGGKTVRSFITNDGQIHLVDDQMRPLADLALLANRDHGVLAADTHDFLVLGEEHYVMVAYRKKVVDLSSLDPAWSDAATVVSAVVQETDHGTVVLEWESTDVPSLYADSVDGNAFSATASSDYVHLNSIQIDPLDGNVLVSLRHTNSILKLDRATGATLWTLGGTSDQFGLAPEMRFSHQHHARRLDDGTLTVFDNGNNAHPTRVLSFALDEGRRTVSAFETIYERPAEQSDTTFMGSVFRMAPSRYLIGWGGRGDSKGGPAVTEVVDGAPVWSLAFTSPSVFSYRAIPPGHI